MRGTEVAYGGMRCAVLSSHIVLRDVWYLARASSRLVPSAIRLCAAYAMSGTDLAYRAIVRYWPSEWSYLPTRFCYAMSGTDLAYRAICLRGSATRCPVLS
eukprot:3462467-Rhodomonas_salina.2